MKYLIFSIVFILVSGIFFSAESFDRLDTPQNVSIEPDTDSVAVEWDSVTGADFYVIYWGTSADLANDPVVVEDDTHRTVSNLLPDTLYYFSVSAKTEFDQESERSETQSVRTLPAVPDPPENFWITNIEEITETSVGLQWTRPSDQEIDAYRIYYGTASEQYDQHVEVNNATLNVIIDNLDSNVRYYFNITSIIIPVDGPSRESGFSGEIIIDTLPDSYPPDTPEQLRGLLTDDGKITVSVDPGNLRMVDFKGVVIHYGQSAGMLDNSVDLQNRSSHVFTGLPRQTTWYFAATAYDHFGNISPPTDEISVSVENIESYTERFDTFDSGCFIGSLGVSRQPAYDTTDLKNKVGISGGYYYPSESGFKDFYGRDNYPIFMFYERSLHRYFSIDLKAGYMKSSGKMRTQASDLPTGQDASFTMVPTSASVNFKFPVSNFVWGFAGVGPDYWYVRETSDMAGHDSVSKWIGGYHGRAGIWLYNMDTRYRRWGMLFETQYSIVDRFGENDIDLGGWLFLIGGVYNF